jgi:glycosyltransferase involved in cell wall biosynthesis
MLWSRLNAPGLAECRIGVRYTNNEYLRHERHPGLCAFLRTEYPPFPGSGVVRTVTREMNRWRRRANRRCSLSLLGDWPYDVFHPTYYDAYFLQGLRGKPYVLTVFDMVHELFGGEYQEYRDGTAEAKKRLAQGASRVIAISEQTRQDVIRLHGFRPDKVVAIHLGAPAVRQQSRQRSDGDVDRPFILYVGSRERHKNFAFFLTACAPVLKKYGIRCVCTGSNSFTADESDLIRRLGLAGLASWRTSTDSELADLYTGAICLAYPSRYEGFGLPVLEAFACSCPVAASNTSSIPEVGGEAALYFDPLDRDSIAAAIELMLTDDALRLRLRERGRKRALDFSWDNMARRTADVYREALS